MKLSDLTVQQVAQLIILAQLVNNTVNIPAKRKALNNQTLKYFLDSARTIERTEQQLKQMTKEKISSVRQTSIKTGTTTISTGSQTARSRKVTRNSQQFPATVEHVGTHT